MAQKESKIERGRISLRIEPEATYLGYRATAWLMTTNLIFTCPVTNQNVQRRFEGTPDHDYELVTCLACNGVHFISVRTGKTVKREEK